MFPFSRYSDSLTLELLSIELGITLISPVVRTLLRTNGIPIMVDVPLDQAPERLKTREICRHAMDSAEIQL